VDTKHPEHTFLPSNGDILVLLAYIFIDFNMFLRLPCHQLRLQVAVLQQ